MTTAATVLIDPAAAPVFGVLGLTAQIAWPLFRTRKTMLAVQLTAACCYGLSYALMGQGTASATCLSGAAQTGVALLAGNRQSSLRIGYVFLPIVLCAGALTYSGLPTLLAVTACCLSMIGRMQTDTLRMRGVQLTASPFGAAHDIVTGSWPCLAGAFLSFTIAAFAFRRELHRKKFNLNDGKFLNCLAGLAKAALPRFNTYKGA